MKKTMWKLTVLLLAVMMCAAFVGCTTEKEDPPADGQTSEETEGDKPTGEAENEKEEEKEVSPEELVSDVVTEAEWAAAFAAENFDNVKIVSPVMISGSKEDGPFTIDYTTIIIYSGDLAHMTISVETTGTGALVNEYKNMIRDMMYELGRNVLAEVKVLDVYYDFETEILYLKNTNGVWEKTTMPGNSMLSQMLNIRLLFPQTMGSIYPQLRYDEALKGYRMDYPGSENTYNVYKLKGGKMVAGLSEGIIERGAVQTCKATYTYGGQSVTLPEVK